MRVGREGEGEESGGERSGAERSGGSGKSSECLRGTRVTARWFQELRILRPLRVDDQHLQCVDPLCKLPLIFRWAQ